MLAVFVELERDISGDRIRTTTAKTTAIEGPRRPGDRTDSGVSLEPLGEAFYVLDSLLADITTALYSAVVSARRADVHRDPTTSTGRFELRHWLRAKARRSSRFPSGSKRRLRCTNVRGGR
jgi:hypothetical protein